MDPICFRNQKSTLCMGHTRRLFVYFRPFPNFKYNSKFDYKSLDDILGIWTREGWVVSADESTELCPPYKLRPFLNEEMHINTPPPKCCSIPSCLMTSIWMPLSDSVSEGYVLWFQDYWSISRPFRKTWSTSGSWFFKIFGNTVPTPAPSSLNFKPSIHSTNYLFLRAQFKLVAWVCARMIKFAYNGFRIRKDILENKVTRHNL